MTIKIGIAGISGRIGQRLGSWPKADNGGGVYNTATAEGTDPNGGSVTGSSVDPTPIDPTNPTNPPVDPNCPDCTITSLANPMISVTKEGTYVDTDGNGYINAGDEIEYTFEVTNTGNVTVSDLVINDTTIGVTDLAVVSPVLSPGQVGTASATYTITQADVDAGEVVNTAVAEGTDPSGEAVTDDSDNPNNTTDEDTNGDGDPDDATVTSLFNPLVSVEKDGEYVDTDGNGVINVGDHITYTFTVTNTGNVTVSDLVINDTTIGVTDMAVTPDSLAAGESGTATVGTTWTNCGHPTSSPLETIMYGNPLREFYLDDLSGHSFSFCDGGGNDGNWWYYNDSVLDKCEKDSVGVTYKNKDYCEYLF